MTLAVTKNAAYSLVATAPSPATSGTTLVLTAGEGARFPQPSTDGPFAVTIWATGAQPVFGAGGATGGNFEIALCTARTTDTLTLTRAQEGTTARTVVVGDQVAETWTALTFRNAQNMPRSARSSNTVLGVIDGGTVVCATAAYTQTLAAAATLGAGWWVIVKNDTNSGTVALVIDPNGSETIDGLTTATMYSGETRLIECDGSNFFSQLLEGGYAKFTPGSSSFIVPAGISELDVVCVGSGGQGGGGASAVSTAKSGGSGGGGGAVTRAIIRGSDLTAGATVTVTVDAGGSGSGAGGSAGAGAAGSNGANGATTTFGSLLKAGGGGGGIGGTNASIQAGGGGSVINSATTLTAGTPSSATPIGGQAANAPGTAAAGISAEWGGASGGGAGTTTPTQGGSSIFGGPGGGSGGQVSVANVGNGGAAGGNTQAYTVGGGTAGGTGGATPTTPSAGVFKGPYCGAGGGGGGGGTAVAGANGGAGGIGAGGGGGGSSSSATSSAVGGTGGAGGPGECRVFYS